MERVIVLALVVAVLRIGSLGVLGRAAVTVAVWDNRGAQRAVEALFTIVLDGSKVDPVQAYSIDTFRQVRRILAKNPRLHALLERTSVFKEIPKV